MRSSIVRDERGARIIIDEIAYEPIAFRSFRPEDRNVGEFADAGVRLMSVLATGLDCTLFVPYSSYGEIWLGPESYDFGPLDRQMELFLSKAPNAYFNLMLQLDTRKWYLEQNPECSNTFYNLVEMAGYRKWREDTLAYLLDVVDYAEAHYGERIFAYSLFCGTSTEWYTNSQARNEESRRLAAIKYHPVKEEAFREFWNDPSLQLPGADELAHTSNGVFRSPREDRRAIQYWQFHNRIVADAALYFAAGLKQRIERRKLIGLFYGYLYELTGTRLLREGHLGYERVWRSPDIDMIFAPASYGATRTFAGTSGYLHTIDAVEANGKLCFHEVDHTTHVGPLTVESGQKIPGADSRPDSAFDVRMILRREYALTAVKRVGMWWFDFFGGYYYDAELMQEVAAIRAVHDRVAELPRQSVAQIAVVADVDSMYYLDETSQVNRDLLWSLRESLARVGAPVDYYHTTELVRWHEASRGGQTGGRQPGDAPSDAGRPDFTQYRLVILPNLFAVSDAVRAAIDALPAETALLYTYAPGIIAGESIDEANISAVVGMEIGRLAGRGAPTDRPTGGGQAVTTVAPLPEASFGFSTDVRPLFAVQDAAAEVLGHYVDPTGLGGVALGAKTVAGRTVYYSAVGNLPETVLREIARRCGVHIYYEGQDPIYVCSSLIGIHHVADPEVSIALREDGEWEDLFDGGVVQATDRPDGPRLEPNVAPGVMKLYARRA